MPRLKVTDDEYELLTEEERVGLKEFQAEFEAEQAAEEAAIAAAANGDPEDPESDKPEPEPESEDDDDAEAEDEEDAPGQGESEAAEEDEADEEAEGDEEQPPPPATAQLAPPPANKLSDAEENRLKAIKTELKEIAKQFDDGELTALEMREKQEVLEDERDALKEKKALAAMSVQTAVNTWYYTTIPTFMAQHTEYKDGSLRHKMLDTLVREMQAASENPTDPKILYDAHAKLVAEFGGGTEDKPAKKKKANGNGQQREVPPNFSAIPASDSNQVTPPNKFARLDRLKGVDYEKALAKLSPADREFYLQGG